MSGQTLGQIKFLLDSYGLKPKYKFGQNFLHDHGKLQQILDAADVSSGDVVLEVGPGTGALSTRLLGEGARLLAVEIDTDLEPVLEDELAAASDEAEQFKLLITDVLAGKHELAPLVTRTLTEWLKQHEQDHFKLIANLPYNVATPLIANLIQSIPAMHSAIVMVQKEVCDRLASGPEASKDYGPISVLVQAACEVSRVCTLPPGCFWPAPKVDSAVVKLTRRETPKTDDLAGLSSLLKNLFGQRRKQLGGLIRKNYPDKTIPEWINPQDRPELLDVDQWCRLLKEFS